MKWPIESKIYILQSLVYVDDTVTTHYSVPFHIYPIIEVYKQKCDERTHGQNKSFVFCKRSSGRVVYSYSRLATYILVRSCVIFLHSILLYTRSMHISSTIVMASHDPVGPGYIDGF